MADFIADSDDAAYDVSTEDEEPPPCKYGLKCYQQNARHLAEFSHKFSVTQKNADVSLTHKHPTTLAQTSMVVASASAAAVALDPLNRFGKCLKDDRASLIELQADDALSDLPHVSTKMYPSSLNCMKSNIFFSNILPDKMFRCTTFWISPHFSAHQLREMNRLIIDGDGDVSNAALDDDVTHIVLPEGMASLHLLRHFLQF